jgi:predicted DNA-binding protein with PD1-like motif
MLYLKQDDTYMIRLEDGEVFPDRLVDLLAAESISGGSFTGVGALRRARIAYFNIATRKYEDREVAEQVEVVAMIGNVALHEGRPLVHAHVALGRRDFSVLGGHLKQGVVRPTLEISLRLGPQPLERASDPAYGLPTLDLTTRLEQ